MSWCDLEEWTFPSLTALAGPRSDYPTFNPINICVGVDVKQILQLNKKFDDSAITKFGILHYPYKSICMLYMFCMSYNCLHSHSLRLIKGYIKKKKYRQFIFYMPLCDCHSLLTGGLMFLVKLTTQHKHQNKSNCILLKSVQAPHSTWNLNLWLQLLFERGNWNMAN